MTSEQNQTFLALLRSWNNHQDLRQGHAPVAELATSRAALDAARFNACRQLVHAI